jgi:hypothetical protein
VTPQLGKGMLLSFMKQMKQQIEAFKVWIFPSLVSILAMMIWNDVSEIKADVKALMAQSNVDKTRIDNLERNVFKTQASAPVAPAEEPPLIVRIADNREYAYVKLKKKSYEP